MKILLLIILLIIASKIIAFGQIKTSAQTYYKHEQLCNVIGTIEEDFIIELYNDTLIKLANYRTSYKDQYSSIGQQTFTGKFTISNDTIKIIYLAHDFQVKNKNQKQQKIFHSLVTYPPNVFIINANSITAPDGQFLTLYLSTKSKALELENKFYYWGKSYKSKKEIFGVTKD